MARKAALIQEYAELRTELDRVAKVRGFPSDEDATDPAALTVRELEEENAAMQEQLDAIDDAIADDEDEDDDQGDDEDDDAGDEDLEDEDGDEDDSEDE